MTVYNFNWFLHAMLFIHKIAKVKRQQGRWSGWGRYWHWRGGRI